MRSSFRSDSRQSCTARTCSSPTISVVVVTIRSSLETIAAEYGLMRRSTPGRFAVDERTSFPSGVSSTRPPGATPSESCCIWKVASTLPFGSRRKLCGCIIPATSAN